MNLQSLSLRNFRFLAALLFLIPFFAGTASAQQSTTKKDEPTRSKYPAAKAQASSVSEQDADAESTTSAKEPEKDSPDTIRKREEWFHKQRASANGHIPAGAHRQALEHMHNMMEREGKLVRLPNGTVQEVAPRSVATFGNPVSTNWLPIGPSPTSGGFFSPVTGRITTIAIDPTDATGNTVLIGGAQGGIWRTTDGGSTWTAVGDQNVSLAMGSIAFAPSSSTTVYAGTGEQASIGADIYYGEGVLKSTDHGQTWGPTCTTPSASCPFIGPFNSVTPFEFFTLGGARMSYISVNPSNAQLILVGAQFALSGAREGVYCSADGGATWSNILPGQMSTFVGFATSSVAFAALGDPFGSGSGANLNGIYKSTNANSVTAGACSMTFTAVTGATLPASSSMGRIDLGISPNFAADNTVYASIASSATASGTNLGVWVTTNGGTSWTQTAAPDICQQQCWYDNVIKVDPNNKDIAFFGGSAVTSANAPAWVLRSANGTTAGGIWTSVIPNLAGGSAGLPHVDNHAIAFVKATSGTFSGKVRVYLGNDGGIWRSDDAEAASVTWTNLNGSALQLTQFYPDLSVHPSSPSFGFAGAQDNGSQIYAGTNNWTDNNTCGDGTGTAIDNVIPSTVYVTCNGNNIAVSTVNGAAGSYLSATNGINGADNADFVPPLVTDPSTANVVYTGTTKVYQSTNDGFSWVALSGDLVSGASGHNLTAMAVAPTAPAVVYAGADTGGVFVATNVAAGTGTFAAVTGQASLPARRVMGIAVDPADATGKTAYVAFSGFAFTSANDLIGHLFKTTDGGATWKDVSCTVANCTTPAGTDLPNTPVNTVVVDPNVAGVLYVGTDIGVFEGMCTTTCAWSTLSTGLPRVAVLSLKLHAPSRTLLATTHGRGAWNFLLSNFTFAGAHISSLSQVSATAGAAAFALTVTGNGLTGGTIQFGSTAVTAAGSDTSITGTVPTGALAAGGVIPVTVKAGANTSNALTFTVLGGAPTIASPVSPASAAVNAAATQITVTGTNFSSSSVVLMNPDIGGTPIPTTFVSSTSLHATVPATFMAGFGSTNSVGVQNPPPGGGTTVTTNTVTLPTFVVTAPAPVNDNFINALTVTPGAGGVFADTKDSSGATTETNDPASPCVAIAGAGRSNTIWYKFTPASTGTITDVDTIGSSYDTVLSVWTGASQSALTAFACNDDINPGIVIQSQLTNLSVSAGTTYYFMVSSFGPADPNPIALGGKSVFNLTFAGASGGSYSLSGSAATATAGGSGTSTITLTPAGGFTGPVAITCGTAVPGVTCGALNVTVPSGGANGTGTLTINVTAPSTALSAMNVSKPEGFVSASIPSGRSTNSRGWWALSGVTGVAAVLFLFLPGRKRYRIAVSLGLVCLFTFALGCSNKYGGGGGGGGPVATTTTLTVSSTKQAANGSLTVSATVTATGRTPGGTVTFSADGTALGSAAPLTNGSTGQITVTAAQAPAFLQLVGTHKVTASYSGDAYTSASTSGTLNITITGATQLPISGSPAASNANATVALTIN